MPTTLQVDAGYMWHVDEIYVRILGVLSYLFGVMDGASRFILSHEMFAMKQGCDPSRLFKTAADLAGRKPRILVSDELPDFCKPAKKSFYKSSKPKFMHILEIHSD